jgi:hypothetical protein
LLLRVCVCVCVCVSAGVPERCARTSIVPGWQAARVGVWRCSARRRAGRAPRCPGKAGRSRRLSGCNGGSQAKRRQRTRRRVSTSATRSAGVAPLNPTPDCHSKQLRGSPLGQWAGRPPARSRGKHVERAGAAAPHINGNARRPRGAPSLPFAARTPATPAQLRGAPTARHRQPPRQAAQPPKRVPRGQRARRWPRRAVEMGAGPTRRRVDPARTYAARRAGARPRPSWHPAQGAPTARHATRRASRVKPHVSVCRATCWAARGAGPQCPGKAAGSGVQQGAAGSQAPTKAREREGSPPLPSSLSTALGEGKGRAPARHTSDTPTCRCGLPSPDPRLAKGAPGRSHANPNGG